MERAEKSAQELGILIPSREEVRGAINTLERYPIARLRLSFGSEFSCDLKPYQENRTPMQIVISEGVNRPGIGIHKRFPFRDNLDMLRSAHIQGCDEILLVDKTGVVGEGATCNYAFYIKGRWVTPSMSSGVLPGIMRALAIENSLVCEEEIHRSDLLNVEAMVALSSLRIAVPIARINGRSLVVGPITESFFELLLGLTRLYSVG